MTGDERSQFGNETNRTAYTLTYTKKLNDRLTYAFEHDLGVQQRGADRTDDTGGVGPAAWYSIANYLTYQLSCDWWLGARAEWFRDRDGTRVVPIGDSLTGVNSNLAGRSEFEGDFFEYTVGLNYKPVCNPNLVVRPELRWDHFSGEAEPNSPFKNGTKNDQFTFAVDAIVKF